jgi:hypothetical protein
MFNMKNIVIYISYVGSVATFCSTFNPVINFVVGVLTLSLLVVSIFKKLKK